MPYNFEEFNLVGSRFSPTITIAKTGGIGLSSGFHRKYKLEQYKAAKLYYDQVSGAIGIRLLEAQQEGSFKLNVRPKDGGAYLAAKSFMDRYTISADKYAGKYKAKDVEDEKFGKIFVIDPKEKEL